ncbi:hypothetical protein AVEN_227472-1 [Araneus ventricosus]|uniref:Uncharacterized protein n=1 Tax=Araneus ventricosus TaxID=182803 RepID=A0A4Y2C3M4_ARAVE|nr:hypothetical protein AVEN_227472-1 [Araneus ventricosus]
MERENYKQCSCSTTVNTCKIFLRSLITLNELILRLKEQERGSSRIVQQREESSLNKMRYDCFNKLVGQASSAILFSKLPPTTEATHQHYLRTFHQEQTWQGQCLNPSSWGWK